MVLPFGSVTLDTSLKFELKVVEICPPSGLTTDMGSPEALFLPW